MSTNQKQFYVSTPIYYVNDRPHIGHVYTTTVADIVARYHRLMGEDVFFLTGVDEHAQKVVEAAAERDMTPQQWADKNAGEFRDTFQRLGMSNDDFVRTSEDRHKERVQKYISALLETGDVYLGDYEGWYDAGQEEYVTENNAKAYNYISPFNKKPLVRKSEKNYFFKLKSFREALQKHFESHPDFVQPEARRKEILNRIAEAEDVPLSRSGTGGWGIPMPNDPEQSIYVWIDALFNYLTHVDTDDRRKYWASQPLHLIAKDILWFHAAIWPAMLLALQKCDGYDWVTLPRQVYSHSFWIAEGEKMSKTLGNFVDLEKIDSYVERFSLDALRYFLAANGPLGTTDSDFAEAKFIEVYNSELANTFGNCLSRVSNMTNRYFDGVLPEAEAHVEASNRHSQVAEKAVAAYAEAMNAVNLSGAVDAVRSLVIAVDGYIEETQPFKLAKDPEKLPEVGTILYHCAEALRIASVLYWPIMPAKSQAALERLGCDDVAKQLAETGSGDLDAWVKWGQLKPGTKVQQGDPLFMRYREEKK